MCALQAAPLGAAFFLLALSCVSCFGGFSSQAAPELFSRLALPLLTLAWALSARDVVSLLPLLALGALVYALTLIGWLTFRLTHPPRRTYAVALAQGRPADPSELSPSRAFTSFTFTHASQQLAAWDIPGDAPTGPICIMSHGFGDSKLGALTRLHALLPHCSRVIAWDLPGHGESQGTCAQGTGEVLALVDLLFTLPPKHPVILCGWSLGAGISVAAAEQNLHFVGRRDGINIVGLILESPYRLAITPARNVLRTFGLPTGFSLRAAMWFIARNAPSALSLHDASFDRALLAAKLAAGSRMPVLVLHGDEDHVSPLDDGRAIATACNAKLVVVPRGGHFGLWTTPEQKELCESAVAEGLRAMVAQASRL